MRLVRLYTGSIKEQDYIYVNPDNVISVCDTTKYEEIDEYGRGRKPDYEPYETTIVTVNSTLSIAVPVHYDDVAARLAGNDPYNQDYNDNELIKRNNWISVEERLPENETEVLIYCPEFVCTIKLAMWIEDGFYVDKEDLIVKAEPNGYCTHWMPLPEPPKGR